MIDIIENELRDLIERIENSNDISEFLKRLIISDLNKTLFDLNLSQYHGNHTN